MTTPTTTFVTDLAAARQRELLTEARRARLVRAARAARHTATGRRR